MNYYRDITFTAPTATLTSFPVLVRIQNDKMKARVTSSQGFDVAFQQNGTALPFELDFYDSSTGSGAWWVQVPSLPTGNSTTIRMVYGDSSITTNQSSPTTVWSDYLSVYHFSEANPSQQFNSARGGYDTWSEQPDKNKSVSLVSGGVTGQMLSVNVLFHWNSPSSLSYSTSASGSVANFTAIGNMTSRFDGSTGARIALLAQQYVSNTSFGTYNSSYTRQTPYTEGVLEYMNVSWRDSDKALVWQINDAFESGTCSTSWVVTGTPYCLHCYSSASNGIDATFQVDEIRISNRFIPQTETAYENNILMHHNQYVAYGSEYHSDGTLVREFFPWIRHQIILG